MKRMIQQAYRLLVAVCFLWVMPAQVWGQGNEKWDDSNAEPPSGWSPGDANITITKASELAWVALRVNDGTTTGSGSEIGFEGCTITLGADIDLKSYEWPMIGKNYSHFFRGTFDGAGHQVKNLKLDIDGVAGESFYAGLFRWTDGVTIKNVGVVISDNGLKAVVRSINSETYMGIGGLVGDCTFTTIQNCYVTGGSISVDTEKLGNVASSIYAGGLAGHVGRRVTINDCYSTVNIQGGHLNKDMYDPHLGGLVGDAQATGISSSITNCFTSGNIDNKTYTNNAGWIGGIVGYIDSDITISNCVSLVTIKSEDTEGVSMDYINRICGYNGLGGHLSNNHALQGDRIRLIGKDGITFPDHSGGDAGSLDGEDWDGLSWPSGIFDLDKWDIGTLPIMPKLKKEDGSDWNTNQEDISITPHLLTIKTTGSGEVKTLRRSATAFRGENIGFTLTPNEGYQLAGMSVKTASGKNVPTINSGSKLGHIFTMPDEAVSITASFSRIPEPEPAPVYYTVSLPEIEGLITDPVAGEYLVESWSSFRFYLTIDEEYDQSVPVVTTDRWETLTPRSSDGAYTVKYVRTDVEVFIDDIVKNPDPVGNETINTPHPKVWKADNLLHIQAATDEDAFIYTADGKQYTTCSLTAGEVKSLWLPTGIYFIRIGKDSFKVTM